MSSFNCFFPSSNKTKASPTNSTDFKDKIDIYYDGIYIDKYANNDFVQGVTTNPSLLNNKDITYNNYKEFALSVIHKVPNLNVSFEVFADDEEKMIEQAMEIYSWDPKIYVKIPIINSKGESTENVIKKLNAAGILLNITAIFTKKQLKIAYKSLENKLIPSIVSIFCGRMADVGVDPFPICKKAVKLSKNTQIKVLWASTREVYNIFQAIDCGCNIITVPGDIIDKLQFVGKDLEQCSLDTVKKFCEDSEKSIIKF